MANEFKIKKGLIVTGASGGTVVDIQGSQGQLFSVTDSLTGSIFAVSDISGVPILDINSSGVSYFDGNLGIGTSSPTSPLHITGTGLDASTPGLGIHLGMYDNVGNQYSGIELVSSGSNSGWIDFTNVSSSNDYNERIRGGAGSLEFYTNAVQRMTISSSGGIRFNTGYGAGTLVTDASGNITVSSGGGAGGPYLPVANPTFTGTLTGPAATITTVTGALVGNVTGNVSGSSGSTTGNAATVTNGVYTTGNQTIGGTKTFSSTIVGSINGNAATATTASNANLLDNLDSTQFLRSDAADTSTGEILFDAGFKSDSILLSGAQNFDNISRSGFYNLYNTSSGSTNPPPLTYGTMIVVGGNKQNSSFGLQIAHERTGSGMYVRGMNDSGSTWYAWDEIWNSGNDGAGSGLDADLLDGQQGSYYVNTSTAQSIAGVKSFSGKITANGGIDGLTLANGGINGANYDIRGVNQLVISDPGEGIVFTGTATMYLNAVDDATDSILKLTNATQLNLNSTARITSLVDPSGAQDAATKNYVDTEIGNIPSGLAFEGNWDASTDTPALAGTTQDNGKFWIVSVAGSTNLSGITDWAVGDWAIYVDNGAGTDAWQKVDNSSSLAGAGSAGKVTFWSSTSNVSFNNNFTYDGTNLTAPRMRVGDGTDGFFYSDTAGRTAFAAGDFYIQSSVPNYFNYATNIFLGDTTGDNVLFRGSTITGTSWGITPAGAATFTTVTGTTGTFTTGLNSGYGVRFTNGATEFLLYNNANNNVLYMRDTTNGAMITTWGVSTFSVDKNLAVTGTSAFTGNATFTGLVSGITPVNAANFVTKAYADGLTPGAGVFLPLTGGTLTGGLTGTSVTMTGGIKANQGMFNNVDGLRLVNPGGGSSVGQIPTVTGAIKITLPVDFTNTMMRMTIKVYEYNTNESFTVVCGGYNYGTNQNWYNCFAHIESNANSDRNFTVRFGRNSTLAKAEIYIGELNSQWSYPQVFVTDFQAGYSSYVASSWQTGWDVGFEASAFGTITQTETNTQVNNWARDGVNLSYTSGSGNVLVTTQPAGNNTTRAASTAFVTAAVATGVGNYLPIANPTFTGTLSGPTLSIQNQINTTSSNLEINYQNGDGTTTNFKTFSVRDGKNALVANFVGSSKATTLYGDLTVSNNQFFNGTEMQGDGKTMIRYNDSWLRINEDNDFVSGIYCGTGILRTDGPFQVGSSGTKFLVTAAGAVTAESTLTLDNGQIVLGGTGRIQGIDTVSASTDAANKAYVDAHITPAGTYLPLAGGTMDSGALIGGSGTLELGGAGVTNLLLDSDGVNIMQLVKASASLQYAQIISDEDKVRLRFRDGMDIYYDDTAIIDYMKFHALGSHTTQFKNDNFEIIGIGTNNDEMLFKAEGGGAVSLYHNNVLQLNTTSTGISTNTIDATVSAGSAGNFVVMDGTRLASRTAAQVLSDIGAGTGTVTGTGSSERIAFWDGTSSISSDSGFTFASADDSITCGAVKVGVGSVSAPSLTFNSDTNTGIYSPNSDMVYVAGGGANLFSITSNGISVNNMVAMGSPASVFLTRNGNRIESRTAAQVLSDIGGTSSSGVTSVATTAPILGGTITSTGTISLKTPVNGNWHNGGAPVVGSDGLMEIGRYIDFHTSNTGTSDFDVRLNATSGLLTITGSVSSSSNITSTGYMQSSYIRCTSSGTRFAPTFSFTSDTNTGMFRNGTDEVALSAGGNTRVLCTSTYVKLDGNVGIGRVPSTKLDIDGTVLVKDGTGIGDLYLGNLGTNNHFRFHTNNSNTYFDMNCGDIYWRQGASTRYTFFPSTANMTVNGTITQLSDIKNKENIVEISDCISKVQAMRGVYYNRTDFNTEVTKVGVIAQEVEAVLPELVLESPETGLKSVAYSELTSVLINAIKEQQEIIEDLKTRITKLEN